MAKENSINKKEVYVVTKSTKIWAGDCSGWETKIEKIFKNYEDAYNYWNKKQNEAIDAVWYIEDADMYEIETWELD